MGKQHGRSQGSEFGFTSPCGSSIPRLESVESRWYPHSKLVAVRKEPRTSRAGRLFPSFSSTKSWKPSPTKLDSMRISGDKAHQVQSRVFHTYRPFIIVKLPSVSVFLSLDSLV